MATKKQLEKFIQEAKELVEKDEQTVSYEEFVSAFKEVVNFANKMKQENKQEVAKMNENASKQASKLSSKASELAELIQNKAEKTLAEALAKQENSLNFMRDWVRSVKDGKDADEEKMMQKMSEMLPEPFVMPVEVTEALDEDAREIEKLKKEIKELREMKSLGKGGGGTSQASLKFAFAKMLQKETPSGDIDGANKTYTTAGTINAVIDFAINGEVITDDQYTYSGSTITMTDAIPAPLSGLPFRITYV